MAKDSCFFAVTSNSFLWEWASVGAGKDCPVLGKLAAINTLAGRSAAARAEDGFLVQRDAAHGRAGLFLDFAFAIAAAAPTGIGKAAFDRLLQFVVGLGVVRV